MSGVEDLDAAEFPAAQGLACNAVIVQEAPARPHREIVCCTNHQIVPNVVNARTTVAEPAIGVLRRIGFAAAYGAVVDRM